MRGRFANRRVVRRAPRGEQAVRLRSAAYAAQAPTRSTPWPINDAGPSWASVRPRYGAIGHQHLRTLLRVHGVLHRSGVRAAVTTLTMRTIADGVLAARYFDLVGVAVRGGGARGGAGPPRGVRRAAQRGARDLLPAQPR